MLEIYTTDVSVLAYYLLTVKLSRFHDEIICQTLFVY